MTLASLLLIVLAAVIHAIWNLLAKRAASVGPVFVFAYNLVACIGYAPWVLYLLSGGTVGWTAEGIAVVLLSGVIHLAYSLCLQRGYQVADLSVIYPVARGTGPMLSTIGAILLLGEVPSGRSLGGLALVVIGIGLIATRGDLSAFRRPGGQSGVRWGGATGGLIASYTVVDAHAVKALGIMPVILDWFSNLLRFALLAPMSYILVLAALRNGAPLSLVAPMREMSMMVGAVLAMVILREAVGIWRLAGCGVLIVGVIALAGA
jgi:drug/metabolite transporter (DMT)-like permease